MSYMMRYFTFIALFLGCLQISAGTSLAGEIVRVVTGSGVTKEEAVINGLIEAVQQVKGVSIDATKAIKSSFSETAIARAGDSSEELSLSSSQRQQILSSTKGLIKTYQVMGYTPRPGQGWEAQLRVTIPTYDAVGLSPDNRRKLAVMPFRTTDTHFSFEDEPVSPDEASQIVTQALVTQFSQSRRFTVLDREYVQEFLAEKKIIASPDASITEQAKLGNVLGVDYMVVGKVKDAGFNRYTREIKLTGEVKSGWKAYASVDYRIILMATRQVKWADSVTVELGPDDRPELGKLGEPKQVCEALFSKIAEKIAQETLGNIYPIQIVSLQDDGEVVLNQGGSGLHEGDRYDVFSQGERIIDPYTKEALGYTENWVAELEITRVTPKMSYARAVEGDPSKIRKGNVCRGKRGKDQEGLRVPVQKASASDEVEGIKLPFD